jgi:hypothetical protein
MEKFTFEIEAKLDKATKGVETLTSSVEELKKAQEAQVEGLEKQIKDLQKTNSKTTKAVKGLAKGFKGVGLAMKAAGIGLLLAIFNKLSQAMMANQQVADAVEMVFAGIGIVFKQVSDAIFSVFEKVSDATGGFDALKAVVGGVVTIALNNLLLVIQGLQMGFTALKIAYEKVFGSEEGVKQAQADMEVLKDKAAETVERIAEAGKTIATNVVEAAGEVGQLVAGVVESTAEAINEIDIEAVASSAKRVVENRKNYALMEAQSRRLIEQFDLEAEQQRQIRDDVSLSIADRIKANEKLGEVLKTQAEEEKEAINTRIAALQEQVKLEGESHELSVQLYDLNTELLAIDAKVAGFKSEQLTNEVALKQELKDLDATKVASTNELAIAEANFFADSQTNELDRIHAKREALELEKEIELERLQMNVDNAAVGTQARIDAEAELLAKQQEFGFQKMELDTLEAETKKKMVQQGLDAVINAAGAESSVGKALFVAKQALALKELIMNAKSTLSKASMNAAESGTDIAKGAGKAASSAPPPFNLIPIAIFAAQAIGIVASIRKAMTKTKSAVSAAGAGAGAGSGGGGGISAPSAAASAAPSFNVVGDSGTNQLAEAIGGQSQKPVKAFVVSNDVTSAQSLDRNIVEEASI